MKTVKIGRAEPTESSVAPGPGGRDPRLWRGRGGGWGGLAVTARESWREGGASVPCLPSASGDRSAGGGAKRG